MSKVFQHLPTFKHLFQLLHWETWEETLNFCNASVLATISLPPCGQCLQAFSWRTSTRCHSALWGWYQHMHMSRTMMATPSGISLEALDIDYVPQSTMRLASISMSIGRGLVLKLFPGLCLQNGCIWSPGVRASADAWCFARLLGLSVVTTRTRWYKISSRELRCIISLPWH